MKKNIKDTRILFIHIPKTAGTSFRMCAYDYFEGKNVFFDYSPSAPETSEAILQYFYEEKDLYPLKQFFDSKENCFLSGHFPVKKYMVLFDTRNVVSFVREPVSQVISHYIHFRDNYNYAKTLEEFIEEERFKNVQSRLLEGKPLELYGFIGITEEYEKSLEIINYYFGTDFKIRQRNANENSKKLKDTIDKKTIDMIKKYNQIDIKLYEKAKLLFSKHLKAYEEKKEYKYIYIQEQNEKIIRGVSFYRNSDAAASITIEEDKKVHSLQSKTMRPGLLVHNLPRNGFVGFELNKKSFSNESEIS